MWRFILVTFAFLGWSFFVLSGGSDYKPRSNSLQAQAELKSQRPEPRPGFTTIVVQKIPEPDRPQRQAARSSPSYSDIRPVDENRVKLTLASVSSSDTELPIVVADPVRAQSAAIVPDAQETQILITPEEPDTRSVKGSVVNMRLGPGTNYNKVGKLTRGTEIVVLQDPGNGWLKVRVVETRRIGWMADSLVTAATN